MSKIKNNKLFKDLSSEQLSFVKTKLERKKYKPSGIIIKENSLGNSIYILIEGEIKIEKNLIPIFEGVEANQEDKKVIMIDDSQNYFFGEMSIFDQNLKRSESIFAISTVEVAEITVENFNKITIERPEIGIIMLKNIGLKLSSLLDKSNVELSKMIAAFTIALKI